MAAALDLLKQKRKRLEQEQKKTLAGLEKRKEELETKISVFTEECRQSEENLQQAKEQMKRDIYQKDVPIERVRKMKKNLGRAANGVPRAWRWLDFSCSYAFCSSSILIRC